MQRIFIGKFFCSKFITLSTERHTELSKLYGVFIEQFVTLYNNIGRKVLLHLLMSHFN